MAENRIMKSLMKRSSASFIRRIHQISIVWFQALLNIEIQNEGSIFSRHRWNYQVSEKSQKSLREVSEKSQTALWWRSGNVWRMINFSQPLKNGWNASLRLLTITVKITLNDDKKFGICSIDGNWKGIGNFPHIFRTRSLNWPCEPSHEIEVLVVLEIHSVRLRWLSLIVKASRNCK
jgi:hypothetical protein